MAVFPLLHIYEYFHKISNENIAFDGWSVGYRSWDDQKKIINNKDIILNENVKDKKSKRYRLL